MARITRINDRQIKCLYWPAWRAAEKVLIANNHTKAEADDIRKDIHTAVTGTACSSKDLNNRQLDACLARFAAISAPRDGMRQAALADGACKRVRHAIAQIQKRMELPDTYVESIAVNMHRCGYTMCNENQLKAILKALTYHENRHHSQPAES